MGELWSLANPARPLCLGGIFRALRETKCCPIFGQLGERNAALFFAAPGRSQGCPQSTESSSALVARDAPT